MRYTEYHPDTLIYALQTQPVEAKAAAVSNNFSTAADTRRINGQPAPKLNLDANPRLPVGDTVAFQTYLLSMRIAEKSFKQGKLGTEGPVKTLADLFGPDWETVLAAAAGVAEETTPASGL